MPIVATHTRLHRAYDQLKEPTRIGVFGLIALPAIASDSIPILLMLIASRSFYLYGPKETD